MSFITQVKLAEFKSGAPKNPVFNRRQTLVLKIDDQIKLAKDQTYQPSKMVWKEDEAGAAYKVEQPKRIKRWWVEQIDGTVLLTVRYGAKPLEFAKGKNAVHLPNKDDVEPTLIKLKAAVEAGELDDLLEKQVGFGKRAGKAGLQPN